jgi:hypothetical protein
VSGGTCSASGHGVEAAHLALMLLPVGLATRAVRRRHN